MTCPSCGHDNPESARFCGECGTSLSAPAPCPACGTENPRGQKFCNGCGQRLEAPAEPGQAEPARAEPAQTEPAAPDPRSYTPAHLADRIAASAGALEGERKQVTVLFADVQGSMDLSEDIDSEIWRGVMDRFYALICDGVHRFEGTVNKFTGDGAMALFGAPIAHEDHARRACYAALHLRDELTGFARDVRREHGLSFSVRMGINSGEVVVGAVGDDLHMDYTAIGHTVGLAARMEALSEPGKPYLTKHTAALIDGFFELEDVGELQVKGVHGPVQAYALIGAGEARTRIDATLGRGLSLFVGRDDELASLEGTLARVEEGGRVIGVVAEPGLGKSRLCYEFVQRCRDRGMQVTEGRGVAHGRRIPLLPVVEMMRSYFGIVEGDDGRVAREKIAGRLLLLDDAFRDALPVLFDFLGVPDPDNPPPAQMSGEARQRTLFAAVRRLIHARSAQEVGVILVEDLHWLDPGSDGFLSNLVDSLPGSRTLLVVNFRPEYHADWMQKSYYQQLPLLPLSREAIARLVRNLIGDDRSLDGLTDLIAERTGGNPFFIEEVVQTLVDDGSLVGRRGAYRLAHSIDQLEIPPTVQAVLAARIDRLPEREKSVLQSAAVIGREFTGPVLSRITGLEQHELDSVMAALTRAELVFERTLYPEAQYAFKHPLTEEVAYRSQLGARRARMHAAVAQAIEELEPDRLQELAGLISIHWEQAGEPLLAAQWAGRAATWSGQHHPAEALTHWRRVRALAKRSEAPEAKGIVLGACLWILQFGWRLGISDEEVEEVHREASGIAQETDNAWAMAAELTAYGITRGMLGDVRAALETVRAGLKFAEEVQSRDLIAAGGLGYWLDLAGHPEEALAAADEAIASCEGDFELGRQIVGFSTLIWYTFFSGQLAVERGSCDEGERRLVEGLRLAREHDDIESLGWAHGSFGMLAWSRGEGGDSLAHTREGLAIAERIGSQFSRLVAMNMMALAHLARREWADAVAAVEEGLRIMRESRTGLQYEAFALALLAEALMGLGEVERARDAAVAGVEAAARIGAPTHAAMCHVQLGRALARSRPAEARAELEEAIEIAEGGYISLIPHVRVALAELAALHGRDDVRRRELERALPEFEEQGARGHARRVASELAELRAAL